MGVTHKAKEFRKGEGVRTVSLFLTQATESPVLRMDIRGLLFCWARTTVISEGDRVGLTAVATLKTSPSCLAELYPKRCLSFPSFNRDHSERAVIVPAHPKNLPAPRDIRFVSKSNVTDVQSMSRFKEGMSQESLGKGKYF